MADIFICGLANDSKYMLEKLRESYVNYSKASTELKTNTFFSLEALYECISQCDVNDEDRRSQLQKTFFKYVRKESGIHYVLDNKDGFRVKVKTNNNNSIKLLSKLIKGQFH